MTDALGLFSWPLLLIGAYLVGSIPSAQLLARLKGIDLRQVGSGNIGAGNLTHSVGPQWGLTAGVFDALKGLVPVLLARYVLDMGLAASGMAGLAAVIGHCWSIFVRGRAGRGLATSAGLVFVLDPVLLVWIGGWSLAGWRIGSGFAGFLGWGLLPLVAIALSRPGTEILFLVLLATTLMLRRAQGNPGDVEGANNVLRRLLYDRDPFEQVYGETAADEAPAS
ncbi:MAG TPA: glycerol-3-phosphate acyltransferase [Acidimicrobiia bacterium]|nr:glycerol-3-phosphate acyltransferase [Acidimicrobiia bacterium]